MFGMTTLPNKRKIVAVAREGQENSRNSQARNTAVPQINKDNITQLPEEKEGSLTKTWPQDFYRTESQFLGALSKLNNFLLNPQVRERSGTVTESFWKSDTENQEPKEKGFLKNYKIDSTNTCVISKLSLVH